MPFADAPRPIRTVLVANRGEIACRVMRTCRRLGLRSVAVYSDADRDALHVRSADEAQRLGPAPAAASYLDIDAVIAAARASGADAIHPGYGFLSENAAFVRRCEAEGITFIGPTAAAVAAMGSKIEAKKIAEAAGTPTVPGYHGADQDPETLAREAARIGFPVLIKASAGGGGRGMRLVERAEDLEPLLRSAQAEARSAFGDDAVLVEKFVENPRHLEVQVIGDTHGTILHLFERDCSVQRNNQKIIEEAPAPNLPDAVRARLVEASLKLARAIGYTGAGTMEFIMEAGGTEPYFLEMNTRLQVEHPVTEAITGIDLVEWQIRVAAGLELPLAQEAITARGHAIEVRLAAERPDLGFQPSVGVFEAVEAPPGLRFDTGIAAGSQIGLHYDSMVAKLIAHGPSRDAALARLVAGLDRLVLLGPPTNQGFLGDCLREPAFAAGRATTRFLGEAFPEGWRPDPGRLATARAIAAAAWACRPDEAGAGVWRARTGFRIMGARRPGQVWVDVTDAHGTASLLLRLGAGQVAAEIDGGLIELGRIEDLASCVGGLPVALRRKGDVVTLSMGGLAIAATLSLTVEKARAGELEQGGGDGRLLAPLPGVVSEIAVAVGDRVARGDTAIRMEAMKLVHTLAFTRDGTVTGIRCAPGDIVAAGATLVEIESTAGGDGTTREG